MDRLIALGLFAVMTMPPRSSTRRKIAAIGTSWLLRVVCYEFDLWFPSRYTPFSLVEAVWSGVALATTGACEEFKVTPATSLLHGRTALLWFGRTVETIADPWLSGNKFRFFRVYLNLLAQVLDNRPKVINLVSVVGSPNGPQ